MKSALMGDEETTRSGLFFDAVRIIKEMRSVSHNDRRTNKPVQLPRFAIYENVPGALSSNDGEDWRLVLQELARVKDPTANVPRYNGTWGDCGAIMGRGYSLCWRVLDAEYFGVPQRRNRVFLVASYDESTDTDCGNEVVTDFGNGCGKSIKVLLERAGLQRNFEESRKPGEEFTTYFAQSLAESSQSQGIVFAKSRRAKNPDDFTTWKEADASNTLNGFDLGEKRCNELVVSNTIGFDPGASRDVGQYCLEDVANTLTIGSCPGYHNGVAVEITNADVNSYGCNVGATVRLNSSYIWKEVCPTLRTESGDNLASVITNQDIKAFSFDSLDSNSMKSSNPNSGCREVEISKCLDTSVPDPSKNQGGVAICFNGNFNAVETEKTPTLTGQHNSTVSDTTQLLAQPIGIDLYNQAETGNVSKTLNAGTDADHTPCVAEPIVLESNQNHGQITQNGVSPTLTASMGMGGGYVPMITEERPTETFSASKASFFTMASEEVANTLVATDYKDPPIINDKSPETYVVRRLTPRECTRLQGFPDEWCFIGDWIDTKGKQRKTTDGAIYKALGNSIAIPCVQYIMQGIYQEGARTLGSLFDGISGFPLSGLLEGIYPEWSSEIEEFPIAVIKYHFGDEDNGIKGDLDEWLQQVKEKINES